jgi:TonB family protein
MIRINEVIWRKTAAAMLIAVPTVLFLCCYAGAEAAERDEKSAAATEGKPWDTVRLDVEYDEPPAIIKTVRPKYPEEAREAKIEGDVVLLVYIDENGDVRNAVVQYSPGFAALDEAAKVAALECKFKPATRQGKRVGVWYSVVMQFRLPSDE